MIREGSRVITPWPIDEWEAQEARERGMFARVGPRQGDVMLRAHQDGAGMVTPENYAERRACKRLEARGMLRPLPLPGFPDAWTLTKQGLLTWLEVTE